eukprot:1186213-Prorocentrum_minimum.AAC.1
MYPNGRRYTNVELAYPDVMDGKKADHSHDHPLPAPQLAPVVAVAAEAEAVTAEAEAEAAKAVLNDTAPAEVLTRARDCHYHRESVIATERLLLPPRDGYYHLKTDWTRWLLPPVVVAPGSLTKLVTVLQQLDTVEVVTDEVEKHIDAVEDAKAERVERLAAVHRRQHQHVSKMDITEQVCKTRTVFPLCLAEQVRENSVLSVRVQTTMHTYRWQPSRYVYTCIVGGILAVLKLCAYSSVLRRCTVRV